MCYFVTIATPLTLSEIRSMLPAGLAAQPVDAATATAFRKLHPGVHTVATLLVGSCSCDLIRPRLADPREDERHLRQRYARLGLGRERIIAELERHRRGSGPAAPRTWSDDLVAFVAEHARNAGPTLFALRFGPALDSPERTAPIAVRTRTLGQVRAAPEEWLDESAATLVVR